MLNQIENFIEKIKHEKIKNESNIFYEIALESFEAIKTEITKKNPDIEKLKILLYGIYRNLEESIYRKDEIDLEMELLINQIYDQYIDHK